MIVEITSFTPRVTLSTPAIAAHAPPTTIATSDDEQHVQRRRQATIAAADGRGADAARRYWPSTPMLNRFILNPIATATPAM